MSRRTSLAGGRAHPRSRGENLLHGAFDVQRAGSSPLTRGKRSCDLLEALGIGLIPAHAGKTSVSLRSRPSAAAHPRSRGENCRRSIPTSCARGSSPLTRGKLRGRGGLGPDRRLIPAHAGKTNTGHTWSGAPWAHPRSRGENMPKSSRISKSAGSSPLTRGKLFLLRLTRLARRLIPAHAGKTPLMRWLHPPLRAHPRSRGENSSRARSRK